MTTLFLLVGVALILGLVFLAAFFWASCDGQFDDLDTPPLRILNQQAFVGESKNETRDL